MPQMNKGEKFIFGKSLIREDLTVHFPLQAIQEYGICSANKIYSFTGAKGPLLEKAKNYQGTIDVY